MNVKTIGMNEANSKKDVWNNRICIIRHLWIDQQNMPSKDEKPPNW